MTNYYFEESGNYKITKDIEADNQKEAIERYEEWLDEEFYTGYINLEANDREVVKG